MTVFLKGHDISTEPMPSKADFATWDGMSPIRRSNATEFYIHGQHVHAAML